MFTVWSHEIVGGQYQFATKPRATDERKKPGRPELISTLDHVIKNGFAAYGIECQAGNINGSSRRRKSFDDVSLLDLRVFHSGEEYLGRIVGRISPSVIINRHENADWVGSTAINDIDQDNVGNNDPEYRVRMAGSYVRDQRVRKLVLKRADGRCEGCGESGFVKSDGRPYLETHHIISLNAQGADKPHNVIALCPNDHRRAHFGKDAIALNDKYFLKLSKYRAESLNV